MWISHTIGDIVCVAVQPTHAHACVCTFYAACFTFRIYLSLSAISVTDVMHTLQGVRSSVFTPEVQFYDTPLGFGKAKYMVAKFSATAIFPFGKAVKSACLFEVSFHKESPFVTL